MVVLTGHGTVASAVECIKAGAADYLLKPVDPDELVLVVERVLANRRLRREVNYLRAEQPGAAKEPVGVSAGWRDVVAMLRVAAPVPTPVLLLGGSGTGKEEAARLLHRLSPRARAAFVTVNCAAIPLELFESEFFGHRRGAFTGAIADREGRFQVAHGGTLLLDEVDACRRWRRRRSCACCRTAPSTAWRERPTTVDVRRSAPAMPTSSPRWRRALRADLFYLNVMRCGCRLARAARGHRPLADAFLADLAAARQAHPPHRRRDLPRLERTTGRQRARNAQRDRRALLLEQGEELSPASLLFPASSPPAPDDGGDLQLRSNLKRAERRLLERALAESGGSKRQAARLLGVDERNLGYFLRKHGLR